MIKLYNGMQYTFFRVNCNDNIASHVVRNMRSSSLFKKHGTPLGVISYFVTSLDDKYEKEIVKDPHTKLLRLYAQTWGRLFQVFTKLGQLYYKAHKDGKQDIALTVTGNDENNIITQDVLPDSAISILTDKFKHATMIKPLKMPESEKKYLIQRLTVTQQAIDKIEEYIDNEHNYTKTNYILTYMLSMLHVRSEHDIHKVPIIETIDKLMGKRGDVNIKNLKEHTDESLHQIFGPTIFNSLSITQQLKLRKLFNFILFFKFKAIVSKVHKFERTAI